MMIVFPLLCIGLVLFLYLQKKIFSKMEILTANIPGPRSFPIIGSNLKLGSNGKEILANIIQIIDAYATKDRIVKLWIGPKLFIGLFSPDDVREILSNKEFVDKSFVYDFLAPFVGLTNLFSAKKTAMGEQLEIQRKKDLDLFNAFHEMENLIMYRATRLWAYPDLIYNLSPAGRKQKRLVKICKDFIHEVIISNRRNQVIGNKSAKENSTPLKNMSADEKKTKAFINELFDCNEKGKIQLTDEEISNEVATIIVAGQASTASTTSFVLYALMKHPDIQKKVFDELNSIFNGSDRQVTSNDIIKMKYLEKVIKETLRLWPIAPFIIRDVPRDIKLKSGHILPSGSNAFIFIYGLHRNPDVFPDPDTFDPERFNEENSLNRSQYAYCPFSAGPRTCIGYKYAIVEIKVLISHLLRKYRILPPSTNYPDITLSSEMVLRSTTGVYVRIEKR